jgi:hypothetical protein
VHHHGQHAVLGIIYTLANLAVFAAYATVPMTRLGRTFPMTGRVRAAGALFFLTCGFTHLAMAFFWTNPWIDTAVDVLQACAAWYFVLGFSSLVRAGEARRRRRRRPAVGPGSP